MSRHPFGWDYPAGAEHDPSAPWNAKDNEECPGCGTPGELLDSDGTYERWGCYKAGCCRIWHVQTGPDPDEQRDRMRDDKLTGDL